MNGNMSGLGLLSSQKSVKFSVKWFIKCQVVIKNALGSEFAVFGLFVFNLGL